MKSEPRAWMFPAWLRRSRWAGPVVLLLLTTCMFWKLTLTDQYTWMDQPDMANQVLPWLNFQAREWHSGRAPLWDPFNWGGQPLVGRIEPGAAYPLNWVLFATPLSDEHLRWAYLNRYFVLIHFLAALFCYLLCRDLKRSRGASVLAGAAFGLGGYMGTTGWPQKLNSATWTPLVLLFFLRAMRGERPWMNASLSGAFLGLAFLGGHHEIPITVGMAMGCLWIYRFLREEGNRLRVIRDGALFGVATFMVGALQLLPGLEWGRRSVRWVGLPDPVEWGDIVPYTVHSTFSLFPQSLVGTIVPNFHQNVAPFIGLVALSLAAVGVWTYWRVRAVRLSVALAIGGMLFSLGPYFVFHGVMYGTLPVMDKTRMPATAIYLFHFGVAVALAYGADALRRARWFQPAIAGRLVRILSVIGGAVAAIVLLLMILRPDLGVIQDRLAVVALIAFLAAALLTAWKGRKLSHGVALALAAGLMMMELGNVTGFDFKHRSLGWELLDNPPKYADLAERIQEMPQPVRVESDNSILVFNFGEWFGIDQFNGHSGLTANVYHLFSNYNRFRDLYGVNLYIGREPAREGQVEIYSRPDGVKLFQDPNVMPRVWSVHDVVEATAAVPLWQMLAQTDFYTQAFLYAEPPAMASCAGTDNIRLVSRGSSNVTIAANMACRGMVVLGDTYFPGWHVTVDGERAELYEVYGGIRGVVVDAGQHEVRMTYRPATIIFGALLTFTGFLGIVVLLVFSRRRRGAGGFASR